MTKQRCAGLLTFVFLGAAAPHALGQDFPPAQIRKGSDIYAQNCSPCHGARMLDPNAAFDLRKFPPAEKNRFVNSVTRGKNQMPPWGDLLQ